MALNDTTAAAAGASVNAAIQALSAEDKRDESKVWDAALKSIYASIKADAEVSTTVPADGLISAAAGSPVTGQASGSGALS